jgi:hypothetical protein
VSRVWDDQEKAVAKRRGGKQTKGSGSSWRNKSDVVEKDYRWEMKSTGAKSISVKAETWHKIRKEAILSGRMPVLHLQIGDTRLVVISEDDFDEAFLPDWALHGENPHE